MRRARRWLALTAVLLGLFVWWRASQTPSPKLSFLRFEDVNGVRHAFFAFENRTADAFVFLGSTASLPFAKFQTVDGAMKLIGEPDRNALPFPHVLQPGGSVTFSYPLAGRDGAGISEPFRLCINSQRQRSSPWSLLGDLQFRLPYWLVGPERVTSWSEEVTP